MLLSRNAIKKHMRDGNIIISPFKDANLANCSYDVCLGKYFYREKPPKESYTIYNPYNEKDVERVWGTEHEVAQPLKKWELMHGKHNSLSAGIDKNDLVIWLAPQETILGHTEEFIGGQKVINTMMKARSSLGRNFITVCRCAGWGDVGYINRWTMEITNNSRFYHIPLVVGRRVAQIAFFEVAPIDEVDQYHSRPDSKYQSTLDIKKLRETWEPKMMIPKMWKDREVKK